MQNAICLSLTILSIAICQGQVKIGNSLQDYNIIRSDTQMQVLVHPGQFEDGYKIRERSVIYMVAVDSNGKIRWISTSDTGFVSPEGYKVGHAFSDIAEATRKGKIVTWPGWGTIVTLRSGWHAVLDFREKIAASSRIKFFFNDQQLSAQN